MKFLIGKYSKYVSADDVDSADRAFNSADRLNNSADGFC